MLAWVADIDTAIIRQSAVISLSLSPCPVSVVQRACVRVADRSVRGLAIRRRADWQHSGVHPGSDEDPVKPDAATVASRRLS